MSNPTSNFGWQMPTATDLVTDLPADFEVFGQAVDTDFVDLLGGTTGQILSKTSATDLDFTWINNDQGDITGVTAGTGITGGGTSGAVTITNDMATTITAAGDIVVGTGSGTYDNLPIGTTAQVLTADTTVSPYKVKWATPATPTSALTLINSGTFSSVASVSLPTSSFTSTYRNYRVYIEFTSATANAAVTVRKRASGTDVTTANYGTGGVKCPESGALIQQQGANLTSWKTGIDVNIGTGYFFVIEASSPAIADQSYKGLTAVGNTNSGGGGTLLGWTFSTGTNYDSLTFILASGNFNGIYRVYGYQD